MDYLPLGENGALKANQRTFKGASLDPTGSVVIFALGSFNTAVIALR
jgi:hypothetical protein